MSVKRSAVCYLTRTPDRETVDFAEQLARDPRVASNVDVCIMIDDNNYQIQANSLINFIQINNNECISNGYHSSNKLEMNKDCISWDKAIYYFCQVKRGNYSFVWLIEDDSFIPSVDAFVFLHERYSKEGNGDLICQKNDENLYGDTSQWKWSDVVGKFSPPWYHSMVCAIGCSRRLLDAIANYVQQRRFLPFIEYMFNTIAMQNHLQVVNPPELSTIIFRENWTWEQIRQRPNNWYHPFKDGQVRQENRLKMANMLQGSSQNAGYTGNTAYQGSSQYYGQAPQYYGNQQYQGSAQYQGTSQYQVDPQYQGNTAYQGSAQYYGQTPQYQGSQGYQGGTAYYQGTPQYPNSIPSHQGAAPNSGSVLPSLVYPSNMPPYPPH